MSELKEIIVRVGEAALRAAAAFTELAEPVTLLSEALPAFTNAPAASADDLNLQLLVIIFT